MYYVICSSLQIFLADNKAYRWNVPSWAFEGRQHRFSFNSKCCFRQCLPRPVIQWGKQVKTETLNSHQSSAEKSTFFPSMPIFFFQHLQESKKLTYMQIGKGWIVTRIFLLMFLYIWRIFLKCPGYFNSFWWKTLHLHVEM